MADTGEITAFGTVCPAEKLRFDANGRVPQGNTVTYPAPCGPTAVTFNATAPTPDAGTPPAPVIFTRNTFTPPTTVFATGTTPSGSPGGGHGAYLRHGVGQAVLYRHYIKGAPALDGWFNHQGLERSRCKAALAFPVATSAVALTVARLRDLASVFDVDVIEFIRPS